MKFIAVFCSACDVEEKYTQPATEFAEMLAKKNYYLVWGGTDKGLMKIVASVAQKHGSKAIGATIDTFKEFARKEADELIVANSLGERKAIILSRSDAIVVLVGEIGTLDELTEMMELKKQGKHTKPIVVLNTDNYYEGIKVQLQKMKDDGFINKPLDDFVYFADTPTAVFEYISQYTI